MSLYERIHGKPAPKPQPVPEWVRRANAKRLPVKVAA